MTEDNFSTDISFQERPYGDEVSTVSSSFNFFSSQVSSTATASSSSLNSYNPSLGTSFSVSCADSLTSPHPRSIRVVSSSQNCDTYPSSPLYKLSCAESIPFMTKPTSIACSENAIFVGGTGLNSSVYVWEIKKPSVDEIGTENDAALSLKYVGELMYMCCSVSKMKLNLSCTKLAVITQAGYVYIWDVHQSKFEEIRQQNLLSLQSAGGFLPSNNRVSPIAIMQPKLASECVALDFACDPNHTIIGVGRTQGGGIKFYNAKTLKKICVLKNLRVNMKGSSTSSFTTKINMYEFNCIAIEKQRFSGMKKITDSSNETTGKWVAVGDSCGNICIFYISDNFLAKVNNAYLNQNKKKGFIDTQEGSELNKENEHTKNKTETDPIKLDIKTMPFLSVQICENTVQVIDLCWRPQSSRNVSKNMYVIAACSDGFIRFCGFELHTKSRDNEESSCSNSNTDNMVIRLKNIHMLKVCRGDSVGEVRSICATIGFNKMPVILTTSNSIRKNNNILTIIPKYDLRRAADCGEKDVKDDESDKEKTDLENNLFFDVHTIEMLYEGKDYINIIGNHKDFIIGSIFSPKGTYAVSVSLDKCIHIYLRQNNTNNDTAL